MSSLNSNEIITGFPSRNDFLQLLAGDHPPIIVKFTAPWCAPCKRVDPIVKPFFKRNSSNMICCYLDIDENTDLYAFLKSKKMVRGVPTLLYYDINNHSFNPTNSISGADIQQVTQFFNSI